MKQTFTIDDRSPLITYSPSDAWVVRNSQDKTQKFFYGNTMTLSQMNTSTISFTFNGTAVVVSGPKRAFNGNYSSTLDGGLVKTFNGSADTNQFKIPLDTRPDLARNEHTIILTNQVVDANHSTLTIDSITWETDLDDDGIYEAILDDANPNFRWYPASSSWQTECTKAPSLQNNTCHHTDVTQAYAQVDFQGNAVVLYGSVGPTSGPYSVQIDSRPAQQFTAYSRLNNKQQVLFTAFGLDKNKHTLTITNTGTLLGSNHLEFDFLAIYGWREDPWNVSDQSSDDDGGGSGHQGNSISGGAIAGIVIGSLALVSIGLLLWWLHRRHKVHLLCGKAGNTSPDDSYPISLRGPVLEAHLANQIHPWQNRTGPILDGATGSTFNPYAQTPIMTNSQDVRLMEVVPFLSSGQDSNSSGGLGSAISSPPRNEIPVTVVPITTLETRPSLPPPSYSYSG